MYQLYPDNPQLRLEQNLNLLYWFQFLVYLSRSEDPNHKLQCHFKSVHVTHRLGRNHNQKQNSLLQENRNASEIEWTLKIHSAPLRYGGAEFRFRQNPHCMFQIVLNLISLYLTTERINELPYHSPHY